MVDREKAKQLASEFAREYEQLVNAVSWGVDKRQLLSIIAQYAAAGRSFSAKEFLQLSDHLKANSGWFSGLKGSFNYSVTALLITGFDDPYKGFEDMQKSYQLLVETGFRKTIFTYITAITLIATVEAGEERKKVAVQAKEVYEKMKKHHYFLTSHDDYPLSVLLAQQEQSELIEKIEFYYTELSKGPFRKGNDLQLLSHILAQSANHDRERIVERAIRWFEALRSSGLKVKGLHYPLIGLLVLVDSPERLIGEIFVLTEVFNQEKLFKWYKDMGLLIAGQIIVRQKTTSDTAASTSLAVSIEALLQAQQAAMTAAISAGAAAAVSSGE
ncbi:hypothetical protein A8F95_17480 [Bacillus wudalianchiensis]|uniref:DUF4003 domain-containing protein n=1 Tax=Pseudobacillus wudalianchiensis TaxID=1743143 RepID=A0A1B9AAM5_9BACI|nr:hypothetical protein A8F95_17480 [Bacillus wudalianchiensis]